MGDWVKFDLFSQKLRFQADLLFNFFLILYFINYLNCMGWVGDGVLFFSQAHIFFFTQNKDHILSYLNMKNQYYFHFFFFVAKFFVESAESDNCMATAPLFFRRKNLDSFPIYSLNISLFNDTKQICKQFCKTKIKTVTGCLSF